MKVKIFVSVLFVGAIVFAVYSAVKSDEFKPAEDFPRDALVYVQISDLPQFIKLWNDSKFKADFLASDTFADLQNRHLGRKLVSRWQEFNDAAGFPVDLETLAGLSENRAAIAVYDVGKLEFVFIAPVSDEIFAATKFAQNQDKFTEETLGDGTLVYQTEVAADRGRQKQKLIFAHAKNRFVLATSEKLLAQTLNNIDGDKLKNRLSDDVSFKTLSEKTAAHLASVWTNQAALNDDYYFKHYWLMSDVRDLKNIRAGIFDLEMQEGKLIEHRKFLLAQAVDAAPIEKTQAARMLSFLPENVPFYQLRAANEETIDEAVKKTIFDRPRNKSESAGNDYFYGDDDFSDDYSSDDYSYLSGKYDELIDDDDEKNETVERPEANVDFAKILQPAKPQSVLTFTRPQILPAPLFVEFQRAAVFHLAAAQNFDQQLFEAEIARKFAAQTMISGANAEFKWETKNEKNLSRRELTLPMLDWKIVYAMRGNDLILATGADFLQETANAENRTEIVSSKELFNDLTVIDLDERENAYEQVFDRLAEKNVSTGDLLWGDVSGFLDSISTVQKIEIRKNYSRNIFEEELILHIAANEPKEAKNEPENLEFEMPEGTDHF